MYQEWTPNQKDAIFSRNENLLISAAAGSGKTAVLTERIAQLVMEGVPLRNLLVVTFSKAAASEMRQRISKRLEELAIQSNDIKMQKNAREQLKQFDNANISTIHSFCQGILRRHFHEVGLDPSFRIADTNKHELELIRQDSMEEALERSYLREEINQGCVSQVEVAFCDKKAKISYLISSSYNMLMSLPNPWEWLEEKISEQEQDSNDFMKSDFYKMLCTQTLSNLKQVIKDLRDLELLAAINEKASEKYKIGNQSDIIELTEIYKAAKSGNFSRIRKANSYKLTSFVSWRYAPERAKELNTRAKNYFDECKMMNHTTQELLEPVWEMSPLLRELQIILIDFFEIYQKKKQKKSILDFNDLEHFALKALQNEKLSMDYKKRFLYVFVDEYQDSNRVQEELISKVSHDNASFFVGDVKQSIYRFRAADPSLFLERAKSYDDPIKPGRCIYLNKNFRSTPNILNAVNDVFKRVMHLSNELIYDEREYLKPGRILEKEEPVSLHILVDKNESIEDNIFSNMQKEAIFTARNIRERKENMIWDSKINALRKMKYSDFAILLRKGKEHAELLARIFSNEGIPAFASLNSGYFATIEVQVLLNLLRLIDNRRQDIPLLSVMRAGIANFYDHDIVEIREKYKKPDYKSIYDCFIAAQNEDSLLSDKCKKLNDILMQAKKRARALSLDQLIEWLMIETNYYNMTMILPGGAQRSANLEMFLSKARNYEKSSSDSLHGFIRYMDRMIESGQDMGEAILSGESSDAVRIMTMHASKGLEFPIVYILGLGGKINISDKSKKLLLHRKLGIGPTYFNYKRRIRGTTIYKEQIAKRIEKESVAEELRLLYVAMTRAKEELIMIGSLKKTLTYSRSNKIIKGNSTYSMLDFLLDAVSKFPEAAHLEEILDSNIRCDQTPDAKWKIQLIKNQEWQSDGRELQLQKKLLEWESLAEKKDYSNIQERYRWKYPSLLLPGKLTVSAIASGRLSFDESPRFVDASRMTGADRGVAIHLVLEHLNWSKNMTEQNIIQQINHMLEQEIITIEQKSLVDTRKLSFFANSDIGLRMQKSKKLERELPFTVLIESKDLTQKQNLWNDWQGEKTILQGVIDACFEENNAWILLDYKSDRVVNDNPYTLHKIAEKHTQQVRLYAHALEQLTKKKVSESYIFLLSIGRAIPVYLK